MLKINNRDSRAIFKVWTQNIIIKSDNLKIYFLKNICIHYIFGDFEEVNVLILLFAKNTQCMKLMIISIYLWNQWIIIIIIGTNWSQLEMNSPDLVNDSSDYLVFHHWTREKRQWVFPMPIILGHGWSCHRLWLVRDLVSFRGPPSWCHYLTCGVRCWRGEFLFYLQAEITKTSGSDKKLCLRWSVFSAILTTFHIHTSGGGSYKALSWIALRQKWKSGTTEGSCEKGWRPANLCQRSGQEQPGKSEVFQQGQHLKKELE